ncbi:hypothetical protein QQ045_023025 [Rhodiola kirilowii]
MGCTRCAEVVWKLKCVEKEVEDLKRQRREDAKANEKVACIYATQEQTWFGEKNRLRLQINALLNQMSIFEKRRAECVESLTGKIKDLEDSLASNKQILEGELNRNKELHEELKKVHRAEEELRKAAEAKAEEHAADALKHKTAFVRLVSAHRQLEAELGRAFREAEIVNAELSLILEQKVEAVSIAQKLSLEVANLRKEAEQKDETGSQKNLLRSMWYKHRNPRIKSWQSQGKTYEHQNAEEKKYRSTLEQMHHMELNAFAEQMRLRDEKIEVLDWRLLRFEIESEQFQAHLQELNQDKAQLRQVNRRLEEQLLDYEADLHYLKNNFSAKPSYVESITIGKPAECRRNIKMDSVTEHEKEIHQDKVRTSEKEVPIKKILDTKISNCAWKMDVQALGVFHKVKRLKQQLMMLERYTAQLKSVNEKNLKDNVKDFLALMSLLNKQVSRYESLQARIDELCNRMNEESDRDGRHVRSTLRRKTKEEIKQLHMYLQEALQLQRYMVATGQKLTAEIQTGISSTFCEVADEVKKISSIDMSRFACCMRDLLKEVQNGLEIQSSRIIGDLEGTLACDGMESYIHT